MPSDALPEADDELRTLVSAILSGGYREEIYLSDVSEICRRKPQCAGALRELIDRYRRLGRMPAAQHQKICARIEEAMSLTLPTPPAAATRAAKAAASAAANAAGADGYSFEDLTCDLGAEPVIAASTRQQQQLESDSMPTLQRPPRLAARAAPVPRLTARTAPVPARARTNVPMPASQPATATTHVAAAAHAQAAAAAAAPTPAAPMRPSRGPNSSMPNAATGAAAAAAAAALAAATRPAAAASTAARVGHMPAAPAPATRAPAAAGGAAADIAIDLPAAAPTTPIPEPVAVGRVLHDRYELQLLLGRGGMASVYKAIDRDRVRFGLADCLVAVKVAPPNAARPGSQAALGQEFQSAQRLSHPNVINVFDIDHDGDTLFYTMELLSGARLSQVLRRVDGNVLLQRYALAIIRDIGAAVTHAHARGVVHGDLKPSNVMITHDGQVRVLDFGGQSMPTREPWVSEGDADEAYHPATPAYASCEQLERRRADPRDDIYALACITYLLLSGRHPFDHVSALEARARGMVARRPAGTSRKQWRALRRGLAWGREQQPASVERWLAQLGLEHAAHSLPPLPDLTAAVASGHPWRRAAAVGLPLAAAAAAVLALQSRPDWDWNRALSAAVTGVQNSMHEAWDAAQSLTASSDAGASAPTVKLAIGTADASVPAAAPAAAAVSSKPVASVASVASADRPSPAVAAPVLSAAAPATAGSYAAFAAPSYVVNAGDPAARIVIQRSGDPRAELSFVWWTEPASAEPDVDYATLGRRIEHLAAGQDRLTVYVPIISGALSSGSVQFHVVLGNIDSHGNPVDAAQNARATVTINRGG
jgi:Protein kinase domain